MDSIQMRRLRDYSSKNKEDTKAVSDRKIHINFGDDKDYIPFKTERYVFGIKVAKIFGIMFISLASIFTSLVLVTEGYFNTGVANLLFWITFIALVAISVVSEKIPIEKKDSLNLEEIKEDLGEKVHKD